MIRFTGHVVRILDNKPLKTAFASNPVGTSRRGAASYMNLPGAQGPEEPLSELGWREVATNRGNRRNIFGDVLLRLLMNK